MAPIRSRPLFGVPCPSACRGASLEALAAALPALALALPYLLGRGEVESGRGRGEHGLACSERARSGG